jgi:hypothetical protein
MALNRAKSLVLEPLANVAIPLVVRLRSRGLVWNMRETRRGLVFSAGPNPRRSSPKDFASSDLIEMKEAFLGVHTPQEALNFLQGFGVLPLSSTHELTWKQFQEWVRFLRGIALHNSAMSPSPVGYRDEAYTSGVCDPLWHISISRKSESGVIGQSFCSSFIPAIYAVIEALKLSGETYAVCVNCDCVYQRKGTRRVRFCSHDCGHRYNQRARREAQKSGRK